jgi:ATP phosphoribosyltransferase regulatory subunit
MHDLLGPDSLARRSLARSVTETFFRWGYELVTTPPFEHAEVLERGLDTIDRRDLLRFVEPETGEVALLRPDITPQIARIVATRLRDRPPPWRLCYQGTVVRRRRGRARRPQQIAQAGVECIGWPSVEADLEVLQLAARVCEGVGLAQYRIELGQVRLARIALEQVPAGPARQAAADALMRKDVGALEPVLIRAGLNKRTRRSLLELAHLYGDRSVVDRARRVWKSAPAQQALDEVDRLIDRVQSEGLGERLDVDLGELRGQAYYTGVSFTLLTEGPGEPVGVGGRYDQLLGRFGLSASATGCALDLGNLEWALRAQGHPIEPVRPASFVACGDAPGLGAMADALRAEGFPVARCPAKNKQDALAFARAWGYDAALLGTGRAARRSHKLRVIRTRDGASQGLAPEAPPELHELGTWARQG